VPNILHQVSVPVIDNQSCQDMFTTSGHKKTIRESFLCAGYEEGKKDSCEVTPPALHCTALHCTALHCTVLYCTALYCTALHCTALHCTALHNSALHCTALHCTALLPLHYPAQPVDYRPLLKQPPR
jgi:hypothetical protein